MHFKFESPYALILLLLLFLIYLFRVRWFPRQKGTIRFSGIELLKDIPWSWKAWMSQRLSLLRLFAYALIMISLARPQSGQSYEEYMTEGIDIMLAVDASGSMQAEDFAPKNRLEVAKEKIQEFIKGRKGDRIGMVVFGEESFTICPLTLDYDFLLKRVEELKIGVVPEDKTAIGMGLASALNRLKDSQAKGKIILLLTDGVNNAGKIEPLTAAEMAKTLQIKIYTIAIGKEGFVRIPIQHPLGGKVYTQMRTEIDEVSLRQIAEQSGGQFFRATSEEALKNIYSTIDELEKTPVKSKIFADYKELFPYFAGGACFLLFLERILARSWMRVLP